MKALQIITLAIFLTVNPAFCGVVAFYSVGSRLTQADQVVVAMVRNSSSSAQTLNLELIVSRTLKGNAAVGSSIAATLTSPNVRVPTPGTVQTSGIVLANRLTGRTGLWFLQQSEAGWVVLPLLEGDISDDDLYLPVPSGTLPSAFAYDDSAAPKTKLIQEIGAAAQDPTTAGAILQLEATPVFADLGPDILPMLRLSAATPQIVMKAMGLADQIRLGIPSALIAMASSNLSMFPQEVQGHLASAVCEYRNSDAGGIRALGVLLASQYRACSTYALREIHSPQTIPLLEKLLNDSSAPIRYDAVIGIAQFAMSFPILGVAEKPTAIASFTPPPSVTDEMRQHYPSQGLFSSNEQEYISYWKNWLAAHPAQ